MGVLYHRRDPTQHIQQLFELTQPGGQCLLESLIVEGTDNLIPQGRYARMRNVWCLPTTEQMKLWMEAAGFYNVEILDVTTTSTQEQRTTEWMRFESLSDSLQSEGFTIEGHPAPRRGILRGFRPVG